MSRKGRPMKIILETETADDFRAMFRLHIDDKPIGEGLTAVQAHLLVGDILEKVALPNGRNRSSPRSRAMASPIEQRI
jgi:hypothetical protein